MKKINMLRRILITIVLLSIFVISIFIGESNSVASSLTIADCEDAIKANNAKILQCEEIKKQLHITAELIREQEFYDVEFVDLLSAKWIAQDNYQNSLKATNVELEDTIVKLRKESTSSNQKYIGNFKITHYCICKKCCGKSPSHPGYGITATGTKATPGRTIAVDPKKIPYGTKVIIEGHTYIAEDCGGAIKGNKIDICVSSHGEALQKGVKKNVPVYIVEG